MAIRRGYKVLSPGRWSAYIKRANGGVRYPVNKWVEPKLGCGPLAVFADKQRAVRWAGARDTIHECDYKPSRFRHLWRLWRGKVERRNGLPIATRLASAVRTLE
jgi:hypothetical protein